MRAEKRMGSTVLILSKTNLVSLLDKIDKEEAIFGGAEAEGYTVRAESDKVHYANRERGKMRSRTEVFVSEYKDGDELL